MYCYLLVDGQFVNAGYFDTLTVSPLDTRLHVATLQGRLGPEKVFVSGRPNTIYNNTLWLEEDDPELAKNAFGDMLRNKYFQEKEDLATKYHTSMNILNASYYRQYPPED